MSQQYWTGFTQGTIDWFYIFLPATWTDSSKIKSPFPNNPDLDRGWWDGMVYSKRRSLGK